MRVSIFVLSLLFLGCLAHGEDASSIIAPPNNKGSGCDLDVPGIDKDLFMSFFPKLKAAAKSKDAMAFSTLVLYPMRFNTKPRKTIKSAAALKKEFTKIFSDKILSAISNQELGQLFCRDQGVMIGDGEVWIAQKGKTVGISAINP